MKYIYVTKDDLKKWQVATLCVQQDVQNILDKYGIANWCGGGTLIGAVRETEFLDWDNDIDVFINYRDIKKILYVFAQENLLDKYEIWSQEENCWRRNNRIEDLLAAREINIEYLEFELKGFSKKMFKIFARDGLEIKIHTDNCNDPNKYIKIDQFTTLNVTKYRRMHGAMVIENGKTYRVLPNICVLPMIEISKMMYFISVLTVLTGSLLKQIGENRLKKSGLIKDEGLHDSTNIKDDSDKKLFKDLIKRDKDRPWGQIKLALKIIFKANLFLFRETIKSLKKYRPSGFIVYKPIYYRLIVAPFPAVDIFPIRKMQFEKYTINVPNNYKHVLKIQFGNYQLKPKLEDRAGVPFFIAGHI